jgi:hypothetical protein
MRRARTVAALAATLLVASTATAGPSLAAAAPAVGQCFTVTARQAGAAAWPSRLTPVRCTKPHNFEVYEVAAAPAGTQDLQAYARQACSSEGVSKHYGVNTPVRGVVTKPNRLSSFSFTTAHGYVCAAGMPTFASRTKYTLLRLTEPLAATLRTHVARLRWCMSGTKTRPSPALHARPCNARPVWKVTKTIDLRQVYPAWSAKYPGLKSVRATVRRICTPGAWYASVPHRKAYAQGEHIVWCYKRFAPRAAGHHRAPARSAIGSPRYGAR